MFKLIATLENGVTFVTNSSQIPDLQRIAATLKTVRYRILTDGKVVYSHSPGVFDGW